MANRGSKQLTLEQLGELREKTNAISQYLLQRLGAHLETVRPLLSPKRLLGRYVAGGSRDDVAGADRAVARLREAFQAVCGSPFELPPELDERALEPLENRLDLFPWEYPYEIKAPKETKTVTITSPVRWVLTYSSPYTLAQVRDVLAGKAERRSESLRHFVINALVMHTVLATYAGIGELLADLRYEVRAEKATGLGELPLVTICSPIPSVRPPDDLIAAATRFSGVPAFIELIDLNAAQDVPDPFTKKIRDLLR
ncbi:MAG: hypothetical protein A2V88_17920 [Elusimicrobia bacterium RBG_16_66_12]|nr:MAG: hypothetical protein A2V88_17920 [Elusimicrobia bacterium RBG_16_66_12]